MQLSEAIRLGAMWKPQRFGAPAPDVPLALQPHTCALAAAWEAIGEPYFEMSRGLMIWSVLSQWVACPHCGDGDLVPVFKVIAHLNDGVRWTRARIADWVETIERMDACASRPAPASLVVSNVE